MMLKRHAEVSAASEAGNLMLECFARNDAHKNVEALGQDMLGIAARKRPTQQTS